jgi:8-oxo-dGTP diphosphatase
MNTPTSDSIAPKHIVAVSAYVTNERGEVLLVKTHSPSDTWEIPGGQVEEGEPLHEATFREVLEETGIRIKVSGVTGVYYNRTVPLVSIMFRAQAIGGELKPQPDEIQDAQFVRLDDSNIDQYVARPHFKSRILDVASKRSRAF